MDSLVVERIASDDRLVAQRFFWSAPGIKLFGDHPDLQDEETLTALLSDALKQQPAILSAFLHHAAAKEDAAPNNSGLDIVCKSSIVALCDHLRRIGVVKHLMNPSTHVNEAVAIVLELATKHGNAVYDAVLEACDDADDAATTLLDAFAGSYFRQRIGVTARSSMTLKPIPSLKSIISLVRASYRLNGRLSNVEDAPPPPALVRSLSAGTPAQRWRAHTSNALKGTPSSLSDGNDPIFDSPGEGRAESLLTPHAQLAPTRQGQVDGPSPGRTLAAKRFAAAEKATRLALAAADRSEVAPGGSADEDQLGDEQEPFDGENKTPSRPASPRRKEAPASWPALASARDSHADEGDEPGLGAEAEDLGGLALSPAEERQRNERVVMALANLFVARPETLTAFGQLVPHVFDEYLKLGSAPRAQLNALLLEKAFDENLERLFTESDDLVKAPFFWHAQVIELCTKRRIQVDYSTLNQATLTTPCGEVLHLYSRLLALLLKLASEGSADSTEIARRTKEVLDQFERNADQQHFLLSIFLKLQARVDEHPKDFADLPLPVLSEVAENGVHTIASVAGEGMELCQKAMTTLLQGYVASEPPSQWKALFKEATNVGFMVKYMFREDVALTKRIFTEVASDKALFKKMPRATEVQGLVKKLVGASLEAYGDVGILEPEALASIDFLNQPELLVDLVRKGKEDASRVGKPDLQLLSDVTMEWMRYMIDRKFPPLTPHHTQALVVLMMSRFFGEYLDPNRPRVAETPAKSSSKGKQPLALKAFIAQMSTGEGKSIVIAMLAVFMVKLYNMKVHVLENNEGLLERDYATNAPFYERLGIKAGKDTGHGRELSNPENQICYCLKAGINRMFLRKMVDGSLELSSSVLIVDEVDDLIVNERPNAHYVKIDCERTPALIRCLAALKVGDPRPEGVPEDIWIRASHDMETANAKIRDTHYRVVTNAEGRETVLQLNKDGQVPKVALTSPWLKALNYKLCGVEPSAESHFACVCTPYVFNRYAGIFGLTGSVGGKAELEYLTKTYSAIKFNVPRFLDTCIGTPRKVVLNHGVELWASAQLQTERVVELCRQYFRQVPVLVIASSDAELAALHRAVSAVPEIPSDEVQRLSEFDANGVSLKSEWQTLIDDATKRLGTADDNRCRVTVTDRFGGRGHDFQVVDKAANANGGMLVIATSIPDEREWIQWKGRTARQDRPGQFYVVLNQSVKPFAGNKDLLSKVKKAVHTTGELKGQPDHNARVEILLDSADEGIGKKLSDYATEQAAGEALNSVAEKYFKRHPRSFDAPWPSPVDSDKALRSFMLTTLNKTPEEIWARAQIELGIDIN